MTKCDSDFIIVHERKGESIFMEQVKKDFIDIINASSNIVFFGGAGVSTESNIPDFRGTGGLSALDFKYSFEEVLSHDFLFEKTDIFYDFYKKNMLYPNAKPNGAHIKLAELEKKGKLISVITQNIDGLHQSAGSETVRELHGSIHRNYCIDCRKEFDLTYIVDSDGVPHCDECGGLVRPDVVLYGEQLDNDVVANAIGDIKRAEVMIVGGTSLNVYPAAGLLQYFGGNSLILINKSETPYDRYADLIIRDPIGKFFLETI